MAGAPWGEFTTYRARGLSRFKVGTLVMLILLLPTLATIDLVTQSAISHWDYKSHAEDVQQAAKALDGATSARIDLENWVFAAEGITYGWQNAHLNASQIAMVIGVDFSKMLPKATLAVLRNPELGVGPQEHSDQFRVAALEQPILHYQVSYSKLDSFRVAYEALVDDRWASLYGKLVAATGAWQPPGSFPQHVQVLESTFRAYMNTLDAILYVNYVLSGHPTSQDLADYFSAVAGFQSETGSFDTLPGFPQVLGPRARQVWLSIQRDPHLKAAQDFFTKVAKNSVASNTATFALSFAAYANAYRYISPYLNQLGKLMHAESLDLRDVTSQEQASASRALNDNLILVAVLTLIVVGGAVFLTRSVTVPVTRLGEAAGKVQQGVFTMNPLPEDAPLELAIASHAFNDMASMLHALEAKTIALASEDLSDPVLQEPLPGRAGRALQSAVERLMSRVRQREQERLQLKEEATHDNLTGLLNRAAVLDVLSHDVRRRSGEGELIATIFVDLDGLKTINDTYGHDAGDAAIRATGEALGASTRHGDAVARLGGDEFLVVAHVRSEEDARLVAGQIAARVAATSITTSAGEIPLSCSTGVAVRPRGSEIDPHELIRIADTEMYAAKRKRRSLADDGSSSPDGRAGRI